MKKEKKVKDKKTKEKKAVYIPKRGITGQGEDYHIYTMDMKEKLTAFAMGFAGGFIVIYIFFRSLLPALFCGAAMGIGIQKYYAENLRDKRQRTLLMQFRDVLESLTSSYSSGKNTQGAFMDAYGDMVQIYGENADITKELLIILQGMRSNINVERLLTDFAFRSELDDIKSFADVFEVCVKQGGNIKDIISATRDIINDKIEIELEIGTLLSGNKNELNIMMIMPLVIVLSMDGLRGGSAAQTGSSALDVIVKLISLGIFAVAYLMGRKVTDIKI